ncbi:MAG: alpha-glucosidase C-terminal domain-containing protein, partial [Pseudomonadota bacterium]
MSNHDVMRHVTRWEEYAVDHDQFARFTMGLMLSLRGSVCIYQGEELALPEADVAYEDLVDPYGIQFWPEYKGRDGCRTPMIWEPGPNGGFSEANRTWLPVEPSHLDRSPSAQASNPDSVYHAYKNFLEFRRNHPALVKGQIEVIDTMHNVLAFIRRSESEDILCVFNFNSEDAKWDASRFHGNFEALTGHGFEGHHYEHIVNLPAQSAWFASLQRLEGEETHG